MGLISRIFGRQDPIPKRATTASRARGRQVVKYDAAQTNDDNRKHWSNADDYSPNAANSPDVRRILRRRSRYECSNNGYIGGCVQSQSEDLIGTGPRLQLTIPGVDRAVARKIERSHKKWCDAVLLAEKLLILDESRRRDGEVFGMFGTDESIRHPVKLAFTLVETDMVSDPSPILTPNSADGIKLDSFGNPVSYTILKQHPGDTHVTYGPFEAIEVRASEVVHWFRPDRPRQARGVPETKRALSLAAILRRYTLAVLGAAEWAASMVGVMKTDTPADPGEGPTIDTMDRVEFERGALLTLPNGWEASQFDAKQPTGTYKEFKGEILNEMGRGQGTPFNVIAGNSSGYNYSSGRLDHLPYHRSNRIQRNLLRIRVLDPMFRAWAEEFLLVPESEGGAPPGLPPIADWDWSWNWDGFDSIDPLKDATTDANRLESNTATLAEIYAEYGQDWEEQIEQRAVEKRKLDELGLTMPQAKPSQTSTTAAPADAQEDRDIEEVPVNE